MKARASSIMIVVSCSLLVATAQIFLKIGANKIVLTPLALLQNSPLLLGFALYGAGMLLLLSALRQGELSTLYPFVALSYIWVSIMAFIFLGESLTLLHWMGIVFIFGGVSAIGRGGG
ncbi:MAG TPA: EamA family transporter [Candidatus Nanoarchaeia archaeon]|nr:EamA family transporter [Candidatus Nanoarchaeia archaeon]